MTDDEITLAAMYLLAKNQCIDTRNRARVRLEWTRWHPNVQREYRETIRRAMRAAKWAGGSLKEGKGHV